MFIALLQISCCVIVACGLKIGCVFGVKRESIFYIVLVRLYIFKEKTKE